MSTATSAPSVNWDTRGHGSTPKQLDLDYFGFTRPMTPEEFRRLVPPGVSNPATPEFISGAIAAGEAVCPPFLLVEWLEEDKVWQINGHEGRSRSVAAPAGVPMPVSILPLGIRARHLTPDMLAAGFLPERS